MWIELAEIVARIGAQGSRAGLVGLLLVQLVLGSTLHSAAMAQAAALEVLGLGAACSSNGLSPGQGVPDAAHLEDCCALPGGCTGAAAPALAGADVTPPHPIPVAVPPPSGALGVPIAGRVRAGFAARAPPAGQA